MTTFYPVFAAAGALIATLVACGWPAILGADGAPDARFRYRPCLALAIVGAWIGAGLGFGLALAVESGGLWLPGALGIVGGGAAAGAYRARRAPNDASEPAPSA